MMATTIQISLRRNDLSSFERQVKLSFPTDNLMDLAQAAFRLHQIQYDWSLPLRSIGLRACVLIPTSQHRQITIFDRDYQTDKTMALDMTIDKLRLRYGNNIITRGSLLG
jgi:DNA polymerase-4